MGNIAQKLLQKFLVMSQLGTLLTKGNGNLVQIVLQKKRLFLCGFVCTTAAAAILFVNLAPAPPGIPAAHLHGDFRGPAPGVP